MSEHAAIVVAVLGGAGIIVAYFWAINRGGRK
mgnify:CR=1 FL=1